MSYYDEALSLHSQYLEEFRRLDKIVKVAGQDREMAIRELERFLDKESWGKKEPKQRKLLQKKVQVAKENYTTACYNLLHLVMYRKESTTSTED